MIKEALILSAYERLKLQVSEEEIRNNDQKWRNFLHLAKSWPKDKEIIIEEAGKHQMNSIAGIGQGGSLVNNFQEFVLNDNSYDLYKNLNITMTKMRKKDVVDLAITLNKISIEKIIDLSIQCSSKKKDEIFECLPYIDVLYRVLLDRMLHYPSYIQRQRPHSLWKRFFNLVYGEVFTTVVAEKSLNNIAERVGVSTKESYVYKQMHIRKIVNECLAEHYPREESLFVRAAVAYWI